MLHIAANVNARCATKPKAIDNFYKDNPHTEVRLTLRDRAPVIGRGTGQRWTEAWNAQQRTQKGCNEYMPTTTHGGVTEWHRPAMKASPAPPGASCMNETLEYDDEVAYPHMRILQIDTELTAEFVFDPPKISPARSHFSTRFVVHFCTRARHGTEGSTSECAQRVPTRDCDNDAGNGPGCSSNTSIQGLSW